jgi:hypothetical protein
LDTYLVALLVLNWAVSMVDNSVGKTAAMMVVLRVYSTAAETAA